MALCRVEQVFVPNGLEVVAASWVLSATIAVALWSSSRFLGRRGNGWTAVGIAIMWIPAWQVILQVLPDMVKTWCVAGDVGSILPGAPGPAATVTLSRQFIGHLMWLGTIAVGALVWLQGAKPGWWRRPTTRGMANGMSGFLPMGRGELASMRLGVAAFPLLAGVNIMLDAVTGRHTSFFTQITAYHAVLLAVAAGFMEELLYRGVVQQSLKHLVAGTSRTTTRWWMSAGTAIAVQSVVFAYAHAGYGDTRTMLYAILFALTAGVVVELWGIWTAIALHVLIDFYGFAAGAPFEPVLFGIATAGGIAIAVVVAIEGQRGLRAISRRLAQ
ncbi:MAG: CPBP family intramembrane glutamic endopeptidase [bacterium]